MRFFIVVAMINVGLSLPCFAVDKTITSRQPASVSWFGDSAKVLFFTMAASWTPSSSVKKILEVTKDQNGNKFYLTTYENNSNGVTCKQHFEDKMSYQCDVIEIQNNI